jgi:hypothetical protein
MRDVVVQAADNGLSDDARVVLRREVVEHKEVTAFEPRSSLSASHSTKRALLVRANIVESSTQPVSRIAPSSVRFLPQCIDATEQWG